MKKLPTGFHILYISSLAERLVQNRSFSKGMWQWDRYDGFLGTHKEHINGLLGISLVLLRKSVSILYYSLHPYWMMVYSCNYSLVPWQHVFDKKHPLWEFQQPFNVAVAYTTLIPPPRIAPSMRVQIEFFVAQPPLAGSKKRLNYILYSRLIKSVHLS